ncbi:MAG: hypothetical protein ACRELC_09085 [Gemmatimonadota bacterium]
MFKSIATWLEEAERGGVSLAEAVLRRETRNTGVDPEAVRSRIVNTLKVMREAVDEGLSSNQRSPTGMTGGRAGRLAARAPGLMGPRFTEMLARAIATQTRSSRE